MKYFIKDDNNDYTCYVGFSVSFLDFHIRTLFCCLTKLERRNKESVSLAVLITLVGEKKWRGKLWKEKKNPKLESWSYSSDLNQHKLCSLWIKYALGLERKRRHFLLFIGNITLKFIPCFILYYVH